MIENEIGVRRRNGPFVADVLESIFGFLDPASLARVSRVCRLWDMLHGQVADRMPKPWEEVGEEAWKRGVEDFAKYGLDFTGAQQSESGRKLLRSIVGVQLLAQRVENRAGVSRLTLPKGLTFNILMRIMKDKKVPVAVVWHKAEKMLQEMPPLKAATVIDITNGLLSGSRNLQMKQQQDLISTIQEECGLVLDGLVLEMIDAISFLALLTLTCSPERKLYSDSYTCLQGQVGGLSLMGRFSPLQFDPAVPECFHVSYNGFWDTSRSVGAGAAMRVLEPSCPPNAT